MADPVTPRLRLNAIVDTSFITINGQPYDLRSPGALSIRDSMFMSKAVHKVNSLIDLLSEADEAADVSDQEAELARTLDRCMTIAVEAPDAIIKALSWGHKLSIFQAFLTLPSNTPAPSEASHAVGAPDQTESLLTGAVSSPDSNSAMAGTSSPGTSASPLP